MNPLYQGNPHPSPLPFSEGRGDNAGSSCSAVGAKHLRTGLDLSTKTHRKCFAPTRDVRLNAEAGATLLDLVIALGIGAMMVSVLASALLIVVWLPGERRDRVTVAQDIQFAEHWINRDANSANRFVAGSSPTYGAFSWTNYTGNDMVSYTATYSYDPANGYLMRTEQQNGETTSTLAVGKNISGVNDVAFVWSPSTYSIRVSVTSTVATGTPKEGITTTVRSAVATMAARPRSEPLTSPPGDVPIPPPCRGRNRTRSMATQCLVLAAMSQEGRPSWRARTAPTT